MKKKIAEMMLCLSAVALMTACTDTGIEPEVTPEATEAATEETGTKEETAEADNGNKEEGVKEETTEAPQNEDIPSIDPEDVYVAFFNGEVEAETGEYFDVEENLTSLTAGVYDYESLKTAIAESEGGESEAMYAFLPSADGTEEIMVLRLVNKEDGFLNWNGVFRCLDDGTLSIMCEYEDAYRSYATLYDSGYVELGGSFGAGAHGSYITALNGDGTVEEVYRLNEFYGSFSEQIAYDIDININYENVPDLNDESEMEILEYIKDGKVYLAVRKWNDDADMQAEEQAYIDKLEELGATVVSVEELEKMADTSAYVTTEVTWENL